MFCKSRLALKPRNRMGLDMRNFAPALRRLRQLRGMKQSHLAELMRVNQATVSRWERGVLKPSPAQVAALQRLLVTVADPAQDAALKRLVESSTLKVHLICDRTHRLLAASLPRRAKWRLDLSDLLGRTLLVYATPEILSAEAALDDSGWHEGEVSSVTVSTGANSNPVLPILPGQMLWERIMLSDGRAGRLVTTLTVRQARP